MYISFKESYGNAENVLSSHLSMTNGKNNFLDKSISPCEKDIRKDGEVFR